MTSVRTSPRTTASNAPSVIPMATTQSIPFRLHPRVFAALGSELVTSDVVAIIELVKNSYDALATRVDVRFRRDDRTGDLAIEVEDNGTGMTRAIIEEAWCVVATPYRLQKPVSRQGQRSRRVSGEKGLGRLSAARLGARLELITKSRQEPCWQVDVGWDDLANAKSLDACNVQLTECSSDYLASAKGTLVRILDVYAEWEDLTLQELREQLSRLVSPFSEIEDFEIFLTTPGEEAEPVEIRPPDFLSQPPYQVKGSVDTQGFVECTYRYSAPGEIRPKKIREQLWPDDGESSGNGVGPRCGAFEFEIRAWDIDPDSIENIAQRFDLNKARIRRDIRNYRGISLYRDGILVLPKSDAARDWLGLDLRRVSKVGTRVSTSQLVGYVAITAEENAGIKDTSDRERLEDNKAASDFKKLLRGVVRILENQRDIDRQQAQHTEPPFQDLFQLLSPRGLIDNVNVVASRGGTASEVLPLVQEYETQVEETVSKIERRLVYYSRLASLGTLAAILVHEVRNQTLTVGRLTRAVRQIVDTGNGTGKKLTDDLRLAETAVRALDSLADRFAPLARRFGGTRRRESNVEDVLRDCVSLRKGDIEKGKAQVLPIQPSNTFAAIDPGDLATIILNLLDNALYWLVYEKQRQRLIRFTVSTRRIKSRIYIQVDDSGPGIPDGDEERIFWPGVTRKPEGFGMGLTVASELVAQHGGKMRLVKPGLLGGATFGFDVPSARGKR